MPTTIELTLAKLGIFVAVLAGTFGVGWFASAAHSAAQYNLLLGQERQRAADAQKVVDDQVKANTTVTKEVNDEAVAQIGVMSDTIAGLLLRKPSTVTVTRFVAAPQGAGIPDGKPNGPAVPGRADPPAEHPSTTAAVACLDAETLRDVLDLADKTISEVLLFREYARGTGQYP